jgi:CheY-like chemotaxis protein
LQDLLALPRPSGRAAALVLRGGIAVVVDRVQPPQTCSVESLAPASGRQPWVVGIAVDDTGRAWHVLDPQLLPSASTSAAPPPAASVLVVDDSLVAREAASAALRGARVSFDVATDGRDALAKLRLGAYAVVLSDLEMPHLDGFGLIEQMRASRHLVDQPVVVCSSRLDAATRDRLQPLGIAGFLPKPFAAGELLDTLRPWLVSRNGLAR